MAVNATVLCSLLASISTTMRMNGIQLLTPGVQWSPEWSLLSRRCPPLIAAHHFVGVRRMAPNSTIAEDVAVRILYAAPLFSAPERNFIANMMLRNPQNFRNHFLLFCNQASLPEFLDNLPLQLDNKIIFISVSGDSIQAWDGYRISSDYPTLSQIIANITFRSNGFLKDNLIDLARDPWYRRTNLTGLELRCSAVSYPPYAILEPSVNGSVRLKGLLGELFDEVQDLLGMKIVCYEPEDGLFGSVPTTTGEWVGVLGDVHKGKAALGIPYYADSMDRREAFQPSYSLEKLHYSLLLPKPSTNIDSRSYIEQFSSITWTVIVLFVVVLMAMLTLFNKFDPQDNSGSLTSLRIFCNMGYETENPQKTSYRILMMTFLLLVMVLHVSYSSSLLTKLTTGKYIPPFKDIRGLLQKKDSFTFAVEKDSFAESMIINAEEGSIWFDVKKSFIKSRSENTIPLTSAIEYLAKDNKFVFLALHDVNVDNLMQQCRTVNLGGQYFSAAAVFPLQKDNPVNPILNYVLQKIDVTGVFNRLEKKWLPNKNIDHDCNEKTQVPLGLAETYSAFVLLGMSVLLSLVVVLIECSVKKFKVWKKNDH